MKQLYFKPFFIGATLVAALSALTSIAPVSATPDAWTWADKSAALAQHGVNLTLSAERQGSWLLSDGQSLARFDGTTVTDLSQEARDRGLTSIKLIVSDGREWLIWNKGLADRRGSLWLRDGSSWVDLTNVLPTSVETLEASGHDGQWYLNATANGVTRLVYVNGTASVPQDVTLPLEATVGGHAAFVNGRWFWFGEQAGHAMVWSINDLAMTPVKNIPAASGMPMIWRADASVLVAMGNGLYAFDGSTWTDLSSQATALGLLPADASNFKAAYGGTSWMIVSGNNLYRYDGSALASKGTNPNTILTVSGGNGFAITATDANGQAKLLAVEDDMAETQIAPAPVTTANASAIANAIAGTDLRVEGIPSDLLVGNGMGFTYHASASDVVGMDRIELYVNGARVRICPGSDCTFTATYWTNGLASRTVTFQTKAWNTVGASTQSRLITLNIQRDSTAGITPVSDVAPTLATDAATGIAFAAHTVPAGSTLPAGASASYVVTTQDKTDGLASIEIWLNGKNAKTCTLGGIKAQTECVLGLNANDYPVGTDLFMNARVTDTKGNALWVPATTLSRPAATSIAATPSTSGSSATTVAPVTNLPVFASRLEVMPNVTDMNRGGTLTVNAFGQDSGVGLDRIEISYGGQIRQICRYGIAMSEVKCVLTIDTATLADNTSLSFVARAINTNGQEAWSNGRSVTIHPADWSPSASGAATVTGGVTYWSWLSPAAVLLEGTQEATYNVGTWSNNGIAKIEMLVNGATRKTCGFVSGTIARACAYTISTGDWNHGQVVTVNARVTDMQGHIAWTDANSVTISRGWWEPLNNPGPYVTLSATKNDGYVTGETLGFTMSGWSPNGVDHLELYLNGLRVASCPSDICRYTSEPLNADHIEFQTRLVDRQGKETWTALEGLNRK